MSDLFMNDEKTKTEIKTRVRPDRIPSGYISINLSSNGKLGVPKKIHVRNYNGQDALDLSMVTDEDVFDTLVKILSDMIYEDIDTDLLHEEDFQEIMLNVFFNFFNLVFNILSQTINGVHMPKGNYCLHISILPS